MCRSNFVLFYFLLTLNKRLISLSFDQSEHSVGKYRKLVLQMIDLWFVPKQFPTYQIRIWTIECHITIVIFVHAFYPLTKCAVWLDLFWFSCDCLPNKKKDDLANTPEPRMELNRMLRVRIKAHWNGGFVGWGVFIVFIQHLNHLQLTHIKYVKKPSPLTDKNTI